MIPTGPVLAWRLLPADRPSPGAGRTRLDVIGLGLLAPALAGILPGLSNLSEDGGIGHAGVLIPVLAGIALLGAFIAWAARPGDRHPVVDVRLLVHGAASAFQGAFWWAIGITIAALIPALALPPSVQQPATDMQPLPVTGGFSPASQCSENAAVDNIPGNHSKQAGDTQTRRRGAELEAAILDAAWEQLIA